MSEQKKQFRGMWMPWFLIEYLEQGTINHSEFLVLCQIECLSKRDEGCTATNAYLGKRINLRKDSISRIISNLTKLKLIEVIQLKYQRTLRTAYGKPPIPPEEGSDNFPRGVGGKSEGGIGKLSYQIEKEDIEERKRDAIASTSSKSRKPLKTKKRRTNKHELSKFDRKAAAVLRTMFIEHEVPRLKRARIDTLAEQIRRLREVEEISKERIRETIIWMRKNYGEDEYVPSIFKARDIVDKFGKFEHQMKTRQKTSFRLNGKKITRDNMYDSDNCENGVPRIWVADDGRQYDGLLLERIRGQCRRREIKGLPSKGELDEVLAEMGETEGSVPPDVIGRLW